jgi:hypothetical protein
MRAASSLVESSNESFPLRGIRYYSTVNQPRLRFLSYYLLARIMSHQNQHTEQVHPYGINPHIAHVERQ